MLTDKTHTTLKVELQISFLGGADGSLIRDNDDVYVLASNDNETVPIIGRRHTIDYFHGFPEYVLRGGVGGPMAQMVDDDNVLAAEMIAIKNGATINAVLFCQRNWRRRKWDRMIAMIKIIARVSSSENKRENFVLRAMMRGSPPSPHGRNRAMGG